MLAHGAEAPYTYMAQSTALWAFYLCQYKLAHGRGSHTKDGAVQLTLKVYRDEDVNISQTIGDEAQTACKAVADWLLKGRK